MDIHVRAFFVTFTSKCIQASECTKMEYALEKARGMVADQEDGIDSFLNKIASEWEVSRRGLEIITRPIKHELFYDKEVNHHYSGWPNNKRNAKYDVGRASIIIPMDSFNPVITFENKEFVHGHISDGTINCWGKYSSVHQTVLRGGPIEALGAMFSFAKLSRYGTYMKSRPQEPSNA